MKTLVVIGIGVIAVVVIIFLVMAKIIEFAFGLIFALVAILLVIWLYNKVKDKID